MKRVILLFFCALLAVSTGVGQDKAAGGNSVEVTFKSSDGVKVFADVHLSEKGKGAPVILLFHQGGGDVRGEYVRILPKLLEKGFNVIAADLRKGGDVFGGENRTAANFAAEESGYCDVYPDVAATLAYAEEAGFTGKKIAWGSSYSAALVIKLAAEEEKKIDGVLAFSPASGGPMAPCRPILFIEKVKAPLLALRPGSEMERQTSKDQFAAFEKAGHKTYVAENGVHGSSMLDKNRVEGEVSEHWKVVEEFLDEVLKP